MRLAPFALALLCAAVLFTGLPRVALMDEREARDAGVARELIEHHEVLTPIYAREPLFEKPLLGYGLEVVGQSLDPRTPAGSRAVRATVALALVALTAAIGARHFGVRAGWFAALAMVTSLGLPVAARTDGTQVIASLLGWVGCAGFADAVFGRPAGRDFRLVTAYGALGAALVVAGPLPALWPLLGLALYLRLARVPDGGRRVRPLAGIAIMAGFALPWYGAMLQLHGRVFAARVPFFPYGLPSGGPWYAGLLLAIGFLVAGGFPWSVLLPGAALHAATWWRRGRAGPSPGVPIAGADPVSRERREEGAAHLFIAFLFASLVPIAIYPVPPLSAVLPALPAAALLCGRLLDHLVEDPARLRAPLSNAARMLVVIGTVAAVECAALAPRLGHGAPALRQLAVVLLLTSWAPFLAKLIGRRRAAALLLALPVGLAAPLVSLRVLPALEDYVGTRDVADAMNAASPERAPLVVVEPAPPSLRFYLRRNLVFADSLGAAIRDQRAADGETYLAFRPAREHEIARSARLPLEILERTPSLVLARVRPD